MPDSDDTPRSDPPETTPVPPAGIIRLDDVLKRSGLVGTGGEAKQLIQSGDVTVNGEVETRRRKQLSIGDVIEFFDQRIVVTPLEDM
ncbi:RNA-binding S4 domain-containing protein [Crateriforma conspicua]|uniref:RNA-binding S4 domain-containing protein n=1 Tax=Crateriforma conspicua TaxID=2527996 RepID=UPI001187962F|nr:RNA-binding S4 domain-containing protein [Crateriforma conspicua]QDV61826.1 ribosome-associated protein [Crateriforma conspicua]